MSCGEEIDAATLMRIKGAELNEFFNRCADHVAANLLGKFLTSEIDGKLAGGRIIETEAYCENDFAAHCNPNAPSPRLFGSWPMFLEGGRIYLYPRLLYDRERRDFWHLNFTCGAVRHGSAVLIRSLQPLWGLATMRERRKEGGTTIAAGNMHDLCSGPGKLWESLGWIDDRKFNGELLCAATLKIYADPQSRAARVVAGSRILRNPKAGTSSYRAKDWPRRYVLAEFLENKDLARFLSEPMNDAQQFSSELLNVLKTEGNLRACMCFRSS